MISWNKCRDAWQCFSNTRTSVQSAMIINNQRHPSPFHFAGQVRVLLHAGGMFALIKRLLYFEPEKLMEGIFFLYERSQNQD